MKGKDLFAETLGIQVLKVKDGYAEVSMTVKKTHINAHGFTNGGVIFTLADYAFAEACNFGDNIAVALQVSINFLRPTVEGNILTAEATRVSDGKTTSLYNVTVTCEEKTVAFFSGVAYKKTA
jgi:acyl-CoA thioesterase